MAYADPARRRSSDDELPEVDLTPVLIRCREWREHIRQPIPVLLKNIAAITGQLSLDVLSDALMPLFKKGRILLLVDGLDEIQNDADRSTFVDHLETFLSDYSNIRLVVTSREAGFNLVAPSIARFCSRWRVWLQYAPMQWPRKSFLAVTFAKLLEFQKPLAYWRTKIGKLQLEAALRSVDDEEITRALLTLVTMCWGSGEGSDVVAELLSKEDFFEHHLFSDRRGVWDSAAWGWALSRRYLDNPEPRIPVLERLLSLWLGGEDKWDVTPYALAHGAKGLKSRRAWQPVLTDEQKDFVRQATKRKGTSDPDEVYVPLAALIVAFYSQDIWPDAQLRKKLIGLEEMDFAPDIDHKFMLDQLDP